MRTATGLRAAGSLTVLTAGELPPNVGEFVSSAALRGLLDTLRERCDILLMDTPPMLQVGDAIALTQHVDALVLVARLGVVRRQMVDEVKRTLEASPVAVLGVVITDAGADGASGGYGYGYGYGHYYERPSLRGPADLALEEPRMSTTPDHAARSASPRRRRDHAQALVVRP